MALGAHKFTKESGAALVFFIGYAGLFSWMLYAYLTHRIKWKSRYSMLFFHVTIRMLILSHRTFIKSLTFVNSDAKHHLLSLILGAEGYFTLVLCSYRFLISWHQHNLPSKSLIILVFFWPAAVFIYRKNFMVWMHTFLIFANAAIDYTQPDSADTKARMNVSKIARTAGQSVFLACNFILLFSIVHTIRKDKRELKTKGEGRIHPTLILLLVTWFPLIVRGVFGVLQSAVWGLSYYNPENYEATGFSDKFTAIEYCLGVLPEWLAYAYFSIFPLLLWLTTFSYSATLLLCTYGTSKGDPTKGEGPLCKEKQGARRLRVGLSEFNYHLEHELEAAKDYM
ncbi:hypothetical protein DL96DRAFT_1614795 [Flagelloscypha sp. PMI_526]|nr:hypothetical protein DL96DRAFT_1614795 [Flagelloscypha sp. PMI_526]